MLKALYYPYTHISSPVVVKNALLLWDCVETIVPHRGWRPRRASADKLFNEAVDLVVRSHVPSATEQRSAHDSLRQLLRHGLPQSLIELSPPAWKQAQFPVYPEKFLEQTWRMLEHRSMAHWVASASNYGVPPAIGFLMMSLLADACAGSQIQKITDWIEPYSWIAERYARVLGSPYVPELDVSQVAPAFDRLVTISLEALDVREIPLKRLLDFRKRELRHGGTDYSAMRRRYLSALKAHIQRIGKEATTEGDVRELEHQFKEEIKEDLADLKAELGLASIRALFSKEIAVSAVALAGSLIAPIAGVTSLATTIKGIGIIPLVRTAIEYRGARREILRRHSMSWLFLGTRGRLTLI